MQDIKNRGFAGEEIDSPRSFKRMSSFQLESLRSLEVDSKLDDLLSRKSPDQKKAHPTKSPSKFSSKIPKGYTRSPDTNRIRFEKVKKQALVILNEVRTTAVQKMKSFIPLKQVLKLVFQIYAEKMKENGLIECERNSTVSEFIYEYYRFAYGLETIAEPKYKAFLASLKRFRQYYRINLFLKFVGLSEAENLSRDDFEAYVLGLKFLSSSTLGHNYPQKDTDT